MKNLSLLPFIGEFSALLLCSAGIFLLWKNWRQPTKNKLMQAFAILLLLSSCVLCIVLSGLEFGSIYFFCMLTIQSWLLILVTRKSTTRQILPKRSAAPSPPWSRKKKVKLLYYTLALFFLCGLSGVLLTMTLARLFFAPLTMQLAFSALAFPIFWALASIWLSCTERLLRTSFFLSLACVLMIGGIFTL
jgi:hypothetical protein